MLCNGMIGTFLTLITFSYASPNFLATVNDVILLTKRVKCVINTHLVAFPFVIILDN